jgi:DNA-binding NtrC family response regulator
VFVLVVVAVDDEEPVREIMQWMLALSGYRCHTVPGGREALESLDSGERFDLITTDIANFPMDGLALLERLTGKYADIPVLIISAVHDVSVAMVAIRNGAYDYLLKPFEREQLINTVRRALEHRRLKLENRDLRAKLAAFAEEK